jgi:hypothetical protein
MMVPLSVPLIHLARRGAVHITKLPKAEHEAFEWQAAMEALLLVAEHDGPTMFAMFARISPYTNPRGNILRAVSRVK